jgi:SNF2 family DNA or RNA helicase
MLHPDLWKTAPLPHQPDGVKLIMSMPYCALYDDMGTCKTKQVIDGACELFLAREVDTVVVVCPAQVVMSWSDPVFGEIQKHTWQPSVVTEFTIRRPVVPYSPGELTWVVVSYEYGRSEHAELQLATELKGRKLLWVFDESASLKNPKAVQTKAFLELRKKLKGRCCLLDGYGLYNSILDLYTQLVAMDPEGKFGYKNYFHYRALHCRMGGYLNKKVVEVLRREELDEKLRPYVLRREESVIKLPPRVDEPLLSVALDESTWRVYKSMRDEMVAYVDSRQFMAQHAVTKVLRLSQITSGFLGGEVDPDLVDRGAREISSEKRDAVVRRLKQLREEDPSLKVICWCRFTAELEALRLQLYRLGFKTMMLAGGQSTAERREVVSELTVGGDEGVVVLGQPQAGGLGLNLTKSHWSIYVSNDSNLRTRVQSEKRTYRHGQQYPCHFLDIVATGPQGQKTWDYQNLKALRSKEELVRWVSSAWRRALTDE